SGRPRKPAALHVIHGTARKGRVNTRAPKAGGPLKHMPPPPKDLSQRERSAWVELAQVVGPLRTMTAADMPAFRQMAVTLAVVEEAREALNEHGLTFCVETESGTVIRKRPEVEVLSAFKKQLSVELSRFGLTPADRERVSVLGEDSVGDPLDEFTVDGGE
ncbi:MAG: P27 family phage terminase small subunit, partial [Myxococcaceae bacterium]|nr:P27 family phage terminase small subunit [Myxococcaceae bacterium]